MQPKDVACKRFPFDADAKQEAETLNILKNSTTKHEHICFHLALLFHKKEHVILFPWADKYDLDLFLLEGGGTYVFSEIFPGISPGSALPAMCTQMANIASALSWLHEKIEVKRKHVPLAHLDLKPDNILINTDSTSIVGKWLLTDFGISVSQEKNNRGQSRIFSIRDFVDAKWTMRVDPPRRFGTYQPPEVSYPESTLAKGEDHTLSRHVGRSGDIWSFGCIFAEVLAFAMGGCAAVKSFKQARTADGNDSFWSYDGKRYEPRRSMLAWLSKLPGMYPESYATEISVQHSISVIEYILKTNRKDRPSALKVYNTVSDLTTFLEEEEKAHAAPRRSTPSGQNPGNIVEHFIPPFDFEQEGLHPSSSHGTPNSDPGSSSASRRSVARPVSIKEMPSATIPNKPTTPQSILYFDNRLRSVGEIIYDIEATERIVVSVSLCPLGRRLATIAKGQGSRPSYTVKSYEVSLALRNVGQEITSKVLDQGVTWKHVLVCGDTLAVWGDSLQDEKQV